MNKTEYYSILSSLLDQTLFFNFVDITLKGNFILSLIHQNMITPCNIKESNRFEAIDTLIFHKYIFYTEPERYENYYKRLKKHPERKNITFIIQQYEIYI